MEDIGLSRLRNQRFEDLSFTRAAQAVEWFCAMQGQEYAQTKWSIGLRAPVLNDNDVERQLQTGHILRTHLLRPTWHFVSAKDIRWLLKLTAPTVHQLSAYMYRQEGLDKKIFSRCNNIMTKLLRDGRHLTRDQINAEFKRLKIIASGPRLSYIMMNAELEGLICSGPRIGRQFTYALLEERVRPVPKLSREESLAMLAKRYFLSRGPATIQDFATWSKLKVKDCKEAISLARPHLVEETIGNTTYLMGRRQPKQHAVPRLLLLPIYDEYIMGYKDRSAIFRFGQSLLPAPAMKFPATIAWDGQIIGTWRRVAANHAVNTEFDLFRPMDGNQKRAFTEARDRLEAFSQVKVEDLSQGHGDNT